MVTTGAAATGLAAQLSIYTPLSPVPFTLQTLSVLLVGGTLGAFRGCMSMLLYLVAGVAGVPWFADQSSGWGGPSFGYILGFLVAVALVGTVARRNGAHRFDRALLLMIASMAAVYGVGGAWLAMFEHFTVSEVVTVGIAPFLAADALKVVIASATLPIVRRFGPN